MRRAPRLLLLAGLTLLTPRFLLLAGLSLLSPGCVSRRVSAPALIGPAGEASLSDLIHKINRRQEIRSLTAAVTLQFETEEAAEAGLAKRYRTADGRIILARPGQIRLQVQAPLIKTNLAEMASDGSRFQLLIYPAEYRALIEGSNERDYQEQSRQIASDPRLKKAGPLVNVRPQHLTEVFFFEPIDVSDGRTIAVVEEARQIEEDDRPGAPKGGRVVKSYYVLSVIEQEGPRDFALRRKYWFDRSSEINLARQQSFGPEGRLTAEVEFSGYRPAGSGQSLPMAIRLSRPYEQYSLRLTLRPESLSLNQDIPERAFSIEIPSEWGDSVRTINLDQKGS